MDTLSDMRSGVQLELVVGSDSSFYNTSAIDSAINKAYRKASTLFGWPELQDAKKTIAQASQEYYDYPQNWRSNTIWKLTITDSAGTEQRYGEDPDGSPLSFDDFLNWKTDNVGDDSKKWANQERRYFINPIPTVTGDLNTGLYVISIWGLKNITSLSGDGDTTVFSYSTPEVNDAIVSEARAILKFRGSDDKENDEFKSPEAKSILVRTWARLAEEKAKYEKNQPMFDVPDFFGNSSAYDINKIGRF